MELLDVLIASCIVGALASAWLTVFQRQLNLPPGPFSWPLFGCILSLKQPLHEHFLKLSTKYGPLIYFKVGMGHLLVVNNSTMAKEVLKTHDIEFAYRPDTRSFRMFSLGYKDLLFAPYGDLWKQLRKVSTTHMFTSSKLNISATQRETELRYIIGSIKASFDSGNSVELRDLVAEYNTNVICLMLFGQKLAAAKKVVTLVEKTANLSLLINIGELFPPLDWLDLHGIYKIMGKEILPDIKKVLGQIIEQRNSTRDTAGAEARDILDVLLSLKDDNALSESSVTALLMDMITAGLESSQNVAEFAIAESLSHPHVMQRAQQELDAVVGRKRLVREQDLAELPYVQAIVKETLRLHPPGPLGIPHANPKPVNIAGYTVPAKCKVLINVWAIGRDPACWDRADEFLPERFINSDYDVGGKHFHFIPFSAGRRICVGYPLAMRSIPLVVATLLHSFEWKRLDGNGLETAKGLLSIKLASKIKVSGHPRLQHSSYN